MEKEKVNESNPEEPLNNEGTEQGISRRQLLKGAPAAVIGAIALGGAEKASAAGGAPQTTGPNNLGDLIKRMAGDPTFARQVVANPRLFQQQYNLSNRAVSSLKGLFPDDFAVLANKAANPDSFTAGALTVASLSRTDFHVDIANDVVADSCYYFG
ncbi:MAG TPA: hypothetical protein VE262_21330 [Blastocatellia bacterium]|nr:hypothetical protein [Blastocatellia bacterium]